MSHKIRAYLIDDELNNISLLEKMLLKHCPEIIVIGSHTNAIEARSIITALQTEILFLDIQMPNINGIDFLKMIVPINFEIIFVTAHSEYAIEAMEQNAIGYITKPILADKLKLAVDNACKRIEQKNISNNLLSFLESKINVQDDLKIPLSTLNGIIFINKEDIVYCESSGNYTNFHIIDEKKILVSRQLGEYEKLLTDNNFVRIHDKYIVNLNYVVEYIKGRGGEIILNNKTSLPVSANRKEILLAKFEKWLKR